MRSIMVAAGFVVIMLLSSCVNLHPFYVGEDVDASSQLMNLSSTQKMLYKLAAEMCPIVRDSKVAVVDFIKYKEIMANRNGKYVAESLADILNKKCLVYAKYVGSPDWFNVESLRLTNYPSGFDYVITGGYRYYNRRYFVHATLWDTHLKTALKSYFFEVKLKDIRFSLQPWHIPDYWEIPSWILP